MKIDFFNAPCKSSSNKKTFGLCDDPPPAKNPAYIDENNGESWIAVVENHYGQEINFMAIDNCITIKRVDNTDAKKCDGMLHFEDTVIFVELKDRKGNPKDWKDEAEEQLKETISFFEKEIEAKNFKNKKAYICNKAVPKENTKSQVRMDKFFNETGYNLEIKNRIDI